VDHIVNRLDLGGRILHVHVWHLLWWPVSHLWAALAPREPFLEGFMSSFVLTQGMSDRARWVILVLSAFPLVCRPAAAPRIEIVALTSFAMAWRFFASWFYLLAHPITNPDDEMPGILAWAGTAELLDTLNHTLVCIPPIIVCVALTPFLTRGLLRLIERMRIRATPAPP
jgi:hypothetical protein